MSDEKMISIRLSDELKAEIEAKAEARKLSRSEFIRKALASVVRENVSQKAEGEKDRVSRRDDCILRRDQIPEKLWKKIEAQRLLHQRPPKPLYEQIIKLLWSKYGGKGWLD